LSPPARLSWCTPRPHTIAMRFCLPGRGARIFTAIVSVSIGVFVGLVARGDSSSSVSLRTAVVVLLVAVALGALIEYGAAHVATVRLQRVLDWRKRFGF